MKTINNLARTLGIVLLSSFLLSCDDDNDNDAVSYPEPNIQADWNLVLLPDNSRPKSAIKLYKDMKYNQLFTRSVGWNGGDGVLTVGLPDGNVFWTFNDSFYGVVGENRKRGSCSFPRNSVMVQKSENGTLGETDKDLVWLADYVNWTDPSAEKYFHCRTHLRNPQATLTDEQIANGDIDQDYLYWSGDGTVYDGKLQMLWMAVDNRDGNMTNLGTTIATYNLSGSMPQGYYNDTLPDYLPQEGDYLYRESVEHYINNNAISYGSTLCEADDGHTYLYGQYNYYYIVVARTETHDLNSAWQYYVCDPVTGEFSWQDEYPTDEQLDNSCIVSGGFMANMPWVFKDGDYYYMLAQGPYFSNDIYMYRSENPYGPFNHQRYLFSLPTKLDKLGDTSYNHLYMINLHPALSREGELVISTNTDPASFWDNFNSEGSADFYRPYFYRVYNWKSAYDDDY